MILGFGDHATEDLFHGRSTSRVRRFAVNIVAAALRKLDMLNAAKQLQDLRVPPGNRLEALRGRYQGFYSIRVNNQYRIVFRWKGNNADSVSLMDYHD